MADAVYVMYMGGPDSIEAIEPFLYNLFTDRDIIDFKIGSFLQSKLARFIASRRSKKVAVEYEKMGGASPQLKIAESLFLKVSEIYKSQYGKELKVIFGMTYYKPYIEETYKELVLEEFEKVTVMTLYPQYSYTTSGVCFKRFYAQTFINPPKSNFNIIPFWHMNIGYNNCIINAINSAANRLNIATKESILFFSAHSLPEYTLEKGDLYLNQLKEQTKYIESIVKPYKSILAFQSKTGPMKWLGPAADETLYSLMDERRPVIVVPISFVSDHIETLIELDEQYIKNARELGMTVERVESLNDNEDFAKVMAEIIFES
ncbi:MAG: ferrochelatase [Deferribacterales bacterium]|jgi:ferrochelatase|uniref:ferrochelatase n=1 Tax=Deferrivibrio essentukiensis TaxID=2880922 RepID=UPI0019B06BE8|nr:ferrochelatase [Deferrivibrio essentukiensis]MBC7196644.1 ferrochelatase [Deferribacterales bacterium]MBZ4672117.1 hemH [Deferribacteraceae bacterium]MCB4204351.1 ferrochelatase [Deferrivibrio essentukiensis]